MKRDKRIWISNKTVKIPDGLVEAVELDLIPGVFHVPRMKDACWLYLGGISGNSGYGQVQFQLTENVVCKMGVHVLMLRAAHGGKRILADYQANHKCEVRSCANPRHIYAGSRSANMEDLWSRGAARDQGILAQEVEAQISIRKAMCRPIPLYFQREAKRLGFDHIFKGYQGA